VLVLEREASIPYRDRRDLCDRQVNSGGRWLCEDPDLCDEAVEKEGRGLYARQAHLLHQDGPQSPGCSNHERIWLLSTRSSRDAVKAEVPTCWLMLAAAAVATAAAATAGSTAGVVVVVDEGSDATGAV
jgi:hypothetical protein